MPSLNKLSENDRAVLNSIFNPSQPLGEGAYEDELPAELIDIEDPNTPFLAEAKAFEKEAVCLAESGDLTKSLIILTKAIDLIPDRCSAYNNRAQVYRLAGRDEEALQDLTKAIDLSLATNIISKSFVQALCQRGLLYRKFEKNDLAKSDFTKAAENGSKFAKGQLVEMNPYAALCNQMLGEVMAKLKN